MIIRGDVMKVLGVIHGYNKNVPEGFRPWEEVVRDRIGYGLKVAEFFLDLGADYTLVLSGGYTYSNTESEAQGMRKYMEKEFGRKVDELQRKGLEIILEENSHNTAENVKNITHIARKVGAESVILTTSKDHSARAMYNLAYAPERGDTMVFGAPTMGNYSIGNDKPVVIEPPYWAYPVAKNLFKVPVDKREEVKEYISSLVH